jgi:hypothetical protein
VRLRVEVTSKSVGLLFREILDGIGVECAVTPTPGFYGPRLVSIVVRIDYLSTTG